MSNARNWVFGLAMAALILSAPIIAFVIVITVEMLTDVVTKVGATRFGLLPLARWDGFCCASTRGSLIHVS
jgi:hypothetical protein